MAYASPSVGPPGLTIPTFDDIKQELILEYQQTYGGNVYLGIDSADYQDIVTRAAIIFDAMQAMQQVFLANNPLTAIGTSLDLIGVLIGIARKKATKGTVNVVLSGDANTRIDNGIVKDVSGNLWDLPSSVTLDYTGNATATATARLVGNIQAAPGTVTTIATPQAGWRSVNNVEFAVPGAPIEPDSIYRARLLVAQTKPSLTLPAGTAAAIQELIGVKRSQVYENPTNAADANGNPEHSITCVVEGGDENAIAYAIYTNKGIGCYTNGKVNGSAVTGTKDITVVDPVNIGISQHIGFLVLQYLLVYVQMDVHKLQNFTDATLAAIETGVKYYLDNLGIGQPVVQSEIIGAALTARTDPERPEFSVMAVHTGYSVANPNGSIVKFTNILAVSDSTNIAPGQLVIGPGMTPATTVVSVDSSNNVTLSHNASDDATLQTYSFFVLLTPPTYPPGTAIPVPFYQAAKGDPANIIITIV